MSKIGVERICTASQKCSIFPHYFHRIDEIELQLLQKHHIKTNIPRGLKVNDDEFTIEQKDIEEYWVALMKRKGAKNIFLT